MTTLSFLLPAFLACLILTGIHTYLGIHVVTRGVIFVDIALAQIAALGMTLAFFLGYEPDSQSAYFFGLGFTCLGALFFAFFRNKKIPQEAFIGISFAVASALGILIADKSPHGSEHLKYILSGNILWVSWPQLIKTGIIYSVLGIIHFKVRKKLLLVSENPEEARRQGLKLKYWDLFFYLSFGLVITSSVQMAGILQVFSFLIVPACCSVLFYDKLLSRLILGWMIGVFTSLIGIYLSYKIDLPTGPAIVACFGGVLILCLVLQRLREKAD
ncbi:MAG: metal ABC transporter permease [Deltaproteobacteria bacterium]|nr:metal ABC transporter permease [Deltaproteobacteria bacterium]